MEMGLKMLGEKQYLSSIRFFERSMGWILTVYIKLRSETNSYQNQLPPSGKTHVAEEGTDENGKHTGICVSLLLRQSSSLSFMSCWQPEEGATWQRKNSGLQKPKPNLPRKDRRVGLKP